MSHGPLLGHVAAVMGTQRLLHHIISFDFIPSSSSTEIRYAEHTGTAANKGKTEIHIYLCYSKPYMPHVCCGKCRKSVQFHSKNLWQMYYLDEFEYVVYLCSNVGGKLWEKSYLDKDVLYYVTLCNYNDTYLNRILLKKIVHYSEVYTPYLAFSFL